MKHVRPPQSDPLPYIWPQPPFQIGLVEPEIPPNTGNIARLCAATGSPLHLVEPLGFQLDNRALKRAGLDYWDGVDVTRHPSLDAFISALGTARFFFFSTRGRQLYTSVRYRPGDVLVFGSESKGLPASLLAAHAAQTLLIPVRAEGVRSLNLATAVGIVLYEALRQQADPGVSNTVKG